MKKYFPILLSKAGELIALKNLKVEIKNEIAPVIEILSENISAVELHIIENWKFEDSKILVDFSLFYDIGNRISEVQQFLLKLLNENINIVPVIQENSHPHYKELVATLVAIYSCEICIRVSNNSGGFNNFKRKVNILLNETLSSPNKTSLLLDLGLVENNNYSMFSSVAANAILMLDDITEWADIIISSGSFPENLGELNAGTVHRLQRLEWDVWNALKAVDEITDHISYSDYGTKYPIYSEANFQGSCSIKYTALEEYIIFRGEISGNHPNGNGQYIIFSKRLVTIPEYSGANFSWGDSEINRMAGMSLTDKNLKPGNAGTWVRISQNHHIEFIHSTL